MPIRPRSLRILLGLDYLHFFLIQFLEFELSRCKMKNSLNNIDLFLLICPSRLILAIEGVGFDRHRGVCIDAWG